MHPDSITDDRHRGVLEISWNDGQSQQLSHAFLRSQCKCSICLTMRLRTQDTLTVASEIRINEFRPVGAYGVQLIFSDGHERGIYPWVYLRGLIENLATRC